MAVEVNIPQEFQVSCFSILFVLLSAYHFTILLLDTREDHARLACKDHSARTTIWLLFLYLTYEAITQTVGTTSQNASGDGVRERSAIKVNRQVTWCFSRFIATEE